MQFPKPTVEGSFSSLGCCQKTVKKSLTMQYPPDETRQPRRRSILDAYRAEFSSLERRGTLRLPTPM
jgi:hypothetical protein